MKLNLVGTNCTCTHVFFRRNDLEIVWDVFLVVEGLSSALGLCCLRTSVELFVFPPARFFYITQPVVLKAGVLFEMT